MREHAFTLIPWPNWLPPSPSLSGCLRRTKALLCFALLAALNRRKLSSCTAGFNCSPNLGTTTSQLYKFIWEQNANSGFLDKSPNYIPNAQNILPEIRELPLNTQYEQTSRNLLST